MTLEPKDSFAREIAIDALFKCAEQRLARLDNHQLVMGAGG
jgi:hypothetical protein